MREMSVEPRSALMLLAGYSRTALVTHIIVGGHNRFVTMVHDGQLRSAVVQAWDGQTQCTPH